MKNEVNILMKNAVDVVLGGFLFWCVGYGIVAGEHPRYSNPFSGFGEFFFNPDVNRLGTGEKFLHFFYHVAHVSTSTTIVSGAVAERSNFKSFMLFATFNVLIYAFPAHWIWGRNGFLKTLGAVDIGGSGVVHALSGWSSLVAVIYLGPRIGIQKQRDKILMGNAQGCLIGLFMMWWAFLAFNSGTSFGVSEYKWMFSAKATVTTMISSFGGGFIGIVLCYVFYGGKMKIMYIANCVFSSLVAITGSSYLVTTWEAFIIGSFSALLCYFTLKYVEVIHKVDDAVGAFAVHGVGGTWGFLAVGIFAKLDSRTELAKYNGLIRGGQYLLGVQFVSIVTIIAWSVVTTYLMLKLIDKLVPFRASTVDELLGADYAVHNILHPGLGIEEAVEILKEYHDDIVVNIESTGKNVGHMKYLEENLTKSRSRALSAIFGHRVTNEDMEQFEEDNFNYLSSRIKPRKSEGGGAFGSTLRSTLHFERHPFMN